MDWAKDPPATVIDYYQSKMALAGWQQLEPVSTITSEPTDDGPERVVQSLTFAKDNFQVTVGVGEDTIKDPERGTTRIGFLIERVKAP